MADQHEASFSWPHIEPSTVILTGSFDNWSSSVHLVKDASGFSGVALVPWGERTQYKFIVDGVWVIHEGQPTERDPLGNVNNVYIAPAKPPPPVEEDTPSVEEGSQVDDIQASITPEHTQDVPSLHTNGEASSHTAESSETFASETETVIAAEEDLLVKSSNESGPNLGSEPVVHNQPSVIAPIVPIMIVPVNAAEHNTVPQEPRESAEPSSVANLETPKTNGDAHLEAADILPEKLEDETPLSQELHQPDETLVSKDSSTLFKSSTTEEDHPLEGQSTPTVESEAIESTVEVSDASVDEVTAEVAATEIPTENADSEEYTSTTVAEATIDEEHTPAKDASDEVVLEELVANGAADALSVAEEDSTVSNEEPIEVVPTAESAPIDTEATAVPTVEEDNEAVFLQNVVGDTPIASVDEDVDTVVPTVETIEVPTLPTAEETAVAETVPAEESVEEVAIPIVLDGNGSGVASASDEDSPKEVKDEAAHTPLSTLETVEAPTTAVDSLSTPEVLEESFVKTSEEPIHDTATSDTPDFTKVLGPATEAAEAVVEGDGVERIDLGNLDESTPVVDVPSASAEVGISTETTAVQPEETPVVNALIPALTTSSPTTTAEDMPPSEESSTQQVVTQTPDLASPEEIAVLPTTGGDENVILPASSVVEEHTSVEPPVEEVVATETKEGKSTEDHTDATEQATASVVAEEEEATKNESDDAQVVEVPGLDDQIVVVPAQESSSTVVEELSVPAEEASTVTSDESSAPIEGAVKVPVEDVTVEEVPAHATGEETAAVAQESSSVPQEETVTPAEETVTETKERGDETPVVPETATATIVEDEPVDEAAVIQPEESATAPAVEDEAEVVEEAAVAQPEESPVVEEVAPVEETASVPVVEEAALVEEAAGTPEESASIPVEEAKAVDESVPVVPKESASAAVVKEVKPVEEVAATPEESGSTPVVEELAPVEEAAAAHPGESASAPVVESAEPVEEAAVTLPEESAAVAEESATVPVVEEATPVEEVAVTHEESTSVPAVEEVKPAEEAAITLPDQSASAPSVETADTTSVPVVEAVEQTQTAVPQESTTVPNVEVTLPSEDVSPTFDKVTLPRGMAAPNDTTFGVGDEFASPKSEVAEQPILAVQTATVPTTEAEATPTTQLAAVPELLKDTPTQTGTTTPPKEKSGTVTPPKQTFPGTSESGHSPISPKNGDGTTRKKRTSFLGKIKRVFSSDKDKSK